MSPNNSRPSISKAYQSPMETYSFATIPSACGVCFLVQKTILRFYYFHRNVCELTIPSFTTIFTLSRRSLLNLILLLIKYHTIADFLQHTGVGGNKRKFTIFVDFHASGLAFFQFEVDSYARLKVSIFFIVFTVIVFLM